MFTKGRVIFALFFVLIFVVGLVWSYRKDIAEHARVFKDSKKTILLIFLFLGFFVAIIQLLKVI